MKVELEKDILKSLGLYDTTISVGLDEDVQIAIERKIDNYLEKIDEEKQRKERIDYLKNAYEVHKKKNDFVNMFNDNFVYGKVKNRLMQDGFIYRCKYCWGLNVSGQYGKRQKEK